MKVICLFIEFREEHTRILRSCDQHLLSVYQNLSVVGLKLWNILPIQVRSAHVFSHFLNLMMLLNVTLYDVMYSTLDQSLLFSNVLYK